MHFNGLILPRIYHVFHENVQKNCVSLHWRVMQSLEKNWPLVPKMTSGIWWTSVRAVASLKICTLLCFFCGKYIMFESKKCKGVMCHNTANFKEELTCALKNDMSNLMDFTSTLKNFKTCTSRDFCPRGIMLELKNYRGVMRHNTEGLSNI